MKVKLSEKDVRALVKKPKAYEIRDTLTRGLVLRVGVKGAKVWEVVIPDGRTLDGRAKRKRVRLGEHPGLSVKDARVAAENAKEGAFRPESVRELSTVGDLFERYKEKRSKEMRSWNDVESVWRTWAHSKLARVRLSDLTIYHGLDFRDEVARRSSTLRAASAVRCIRPMLNWAVSEGILPVSPWAGLKAGANAQERDRVLSDHEWSALWQASEDIPYPFGPWVRALMLSAQRLSNVAQMEWSEIHGDTWVIPKEKVKATRPDKARALEVPLSAALANLIAAQPRRGPFVFTTSGDKPIVPGSKLRLKLENATGVVDWRWHDIRRSGMTRMTTGGVSQFIGARVLGHADQSVTGVYDRSLYREEKRAALEALAATLAGQRKATTKVRRLDGR